MKSLLINKKDLRHNIDIIKNLSKDSKIIAVVKGNGYGLGLIEFSKFLIDNGINFLAVATTEEATELRKANIKENILMLSSTSIKQDIDTLIQNNIILTIGSRESAQIANNIGKEQNKKIRVHLKIDTGFGRYGFLYDDTKTILYIINNYKNLQIEGIYSHFSLAYYKNNKWTNTQYERFTNLIKQLEKNNVNIKMKHICNSPAFLNYPNMHLDAVRIGSAFLGRVDSETTVGLKKVGQLKVNISEIKNVPKGYNIGYLNSYRTKEDTKIAIVQFGYMEGYNIGNREDMFRFIDKLRDLSHAIKAFLKKKTLKVKIKDKKYNVIGKLGMYHMDIDITNTDIKVNDEVYIDVSPMYIDSKVKREYVD